MPPPLPTRVLAGVTIPSTAPVNAAIAFARQHLNDMAYNHSMRSMLLGFLLSLNSPSQAEKDRDQEAHAIAAVLHDMGWALDTSLVSKDRRFEVDGADIARELLAREAPGWDRHRVQLVWDAIALHATSSIASFKEAEVAACSAGVAADYLGPPGFEGRLGWEEYDAVVREFPRLNLGDGAMEAVCRLCREKPGTTWDNFVGDVGEEFVEGYERGARSRFPKMIKFSKEVLDLRQA